MAGLAGEVIGMLGGGQGRGLASLIRAFEGNGLGEVMSSWISTGKNLPISADQVAQILGSSQVSQIASRLDIAPEAAASQIAELLPQLVDRLTPNGSVPDSDALQEGLSLLRSKLGL